MSVSATPRATPQATGLLGILRNPASTRNLRQRSAPDPDALMREATSPPEIAEALADLAAAGVDTLVIDGGDGTVSAALTHLPQAFPSLPTLAILPSGNTNLIARAVGGWHGKDALLHLRRRLKQAPDAARNPPILELTRGDSGTARGLIMGLGAYASASRLAQREMAARGGRQVALAILATLRRALIGAEARALRRGVEAALVVDGDPRPPARRFLTIATAMQGPLLLGLNPFWGGGEGPLRLLDIDAPARRLALAAPFVALGRPMPWMRGAGYRSARAAEITITLGTTYMLDGEAFEPPADGRLKLGATTRFRFLAP
ncbi:MAG: diacylglycerol kinase family protein [Pseudomonadota bacterium]